jgi:hypothetical protein
VNAREPPIVTTSVPMLQGKMRRRPCATTMGPCCGGWLALGCALAALASLPARATTSTLEECVEGADFIGHAAYSRDNGMAREAFLDRLEGDFVTIRAFPSRCAGSSRTPTTSASCVPRPWTSSTVRSRRSATAPRSSPPA